MEKVHDITHRRTVTRRQANDERRKQLQARASTATKIGNLEMLGASTKALTTQHTVGNLHNYAESKALESNVRLSGRVDGNVRFSNAGPSMHRTAEQLTGVREDTPFVTRGQLAEERQPTRGRGGVRPSSQPTAPAGAAITVDQRTSADMGHLEV